MSAIVVYESQTGFTERYARWISEELHCDSIPLKQLTASRIKEYDRVIFGGWIMADSIRGLNKITGVSCALAAVFGVGALPACEAVRERIRERNKLGGIPFFYMEGGICLEQLGWVQKNALGFIRKAIIKKKDKNEQEALMADMLGASFDHSDREQVQPLVRYLNDL